MIPDSTQLSSQITKASYPCTKVGSRGEVKRTHRPQIKYLIATGGGTYNKRQLKVTFKLYCQISYFEIYY